VWVTRYPAAQVVEELARAAQGAPELPALLTRFCEVFAEGLAFDRVALSRYDSDTDEIRVLAAHGVDREAIRDLPVSLVEWPLFRAALVRAEPVLANEMSEGQIPRPAIARFGITSALVIPLLSQGRCLGFLSADRAGARFELDAEARSLVGTVAVLAATFLEKALVQDEMRRVDEVKSQFIALASHELRTPAAVIYGIASTLHHRGSQLREEQRLELRAMLHAQSDRLRQLVDQLLDVSRLEAGAIRIHRQRLEVRARIEELVLVLAEKRAGEIRVEIEPELEAFVDPTALDRIVSNLISNALRYGESPITISAEQHDRHFRLCCEDRGPGIDAELAPRLFERFTRGPSPARELGSGLGLAIARSYAHAHGGELLYSPATPRGARFELVLPADPTNSQQR
jgi:signal transduction histidine kinase